MEVYTEVYMGLSRGLHGSTQVYAEVYVGLCGSLHGDRHGSMQGSMPIATIDLVGEFEV